MPLRARRIMWTRKLADGVNGWEGHVNGKLLFSIHHSLKRGEGEVLRTRLPWNIKAEFSTGDAERLKITAEKVLFAFVAKIGASFPEDEIEC